MAGAGDWIDAALAPRSVAIVGASDNPEKIGGRPIKYMLQHGYQGRILPINPGRDRVQGIAAWHSLDAVNVPIDMLLVCVAGEPRCRPCGTARGWACAYASSSRPGSRKPANPDGRRRST